MVLFVYLFFMKGTHRNYNRKEFVSWETEVRKSIIHSRGEKKIQVLHGRKQTVQIAQAGVSEKENLDLSMTDFVAMIKNEFCKEGNFI